MKIGDKEKSFPQKNTIMGGLAGDTEGADVNRPWAQPTEMVLKALAVSSEGGLSSAEAERRLKIHGSNLLQFQKKATWVRRLAGQFKSPVVIVLLVATVVSALLGDVTDTIAIATIVIINAFIGFLQEAKAEAAVEALKKLAAPKAKVFRDGQITEVGVSGVVCGDILVLEAGDYVPADARILLANQLSADEAILTGESLPVRKQSEVVSASASLGDRINMLFADTMVTTGSARALVIATGMKTEIGKIAELLDASSQIKTPLQERLEQVSQRLLWFCLLVVIVVALLGLFHGETWLQVLMSGISLAVAAIPEGLPTVVTITLALAVHRLVKRNVIVRSLSAVETLGSTDVICTDKTGTLTTGKMRVRDVVLSSGQFNAEDSNLKGDPKFKQLLLSSCLCSNASLGENGESTGDPTEVALLQLAKDHDEPFIRWTKEFSRLAEWSFDSERKRMSIAVRDGDAVILHSKGAPESLLPLCRIELSERTKLEQQIALLTGQGKRLLAVSRRRIEDKEVTHLASMDAAQVECSLEFVGLVAIADPPRLESIAAIRACQSAGIKVVMITGDHPVTARAIASELGIIDGRGENPVLSGADLERLTDESLKEQVPNISVYARVSPEHKLRIIRAWQGLGKVVAMTGDGVNDAPALKAASIGISMGRGGTEVARQASSMILTDDNFATIVSAVEEGRAIYGNIRRTIQYLLSGNLAEILIMLGAAIAGWPIPLVPIQLLWINLVTDGIPALALAAEPLPKHGLQATTRPSQSSFFDRHFYGEMIFVSTIVTILSLSIYGYELHVSDEITARTNVFSFLVFAELFRSFASRSDSYTFFQLGPRSNVYHLAAVAVPIAFQFFLHHMPVLQNVFKVQSIGWNDCLILFALTLVPVSLIEIRKWWKHSIRRS